MQVTETLNEGLKRKLAMIIPARATWAAASRRALAEIKDKANIKGFRPGKVPPSYLKKVYGRSAMAEVMQDAINATVGNALTERSERAASQPKVDLPEDQGTINKVLDGEADLAFDVSYEVLPAGRADGLQDARSSIARSSKSPTPTSTRKCSACSARTAATSPRPTTASSPMATISAFRSSARSRARLSRAAAPTTPMSPSAPASSFRASKSS